jgi:hypothetical protein
MTYASDEGKEPAACKTHSRQCYADESTQVNPLYNDSEHYKGQHFGSQLYLTTTAICIFCCGERGEHFVNQIL